MLAADRVGTTCPDNNHGPDPGRVNLAVFLPLLVENMRSMFPGTYAGILSPSTELQHGPEVIRLMGEAQSAGVMVSTVVSSLQTVFEFMPTTLAQQLARLLQEEPPLARVMVECLLACRGRDREVAPTVLLVLPSPLCFRPAPRPSRPTGQVCFLDIYLCPDPRLFAACEALAKTIVFERDMVWQLWDRLLLLPLTSKASIDIFKVLGGDKTSSTDIEGASVAARNRYGLVDTISACERTRALIDPADNLSLRTPPPQYLQYALLFTFGVELHQKAVKSFERQAAVIELGVEPVARLVNKMIVPGSAPDV